MLATSRSAQAKLSIIRGSRSASFLNRINGDLPVVGGGQPLGEDGRYVLDRKITSDQTSETWLAMDTKTGHHVAIKILAGSYTHDLHSGRVWELEALKRMSAAPYSPHCQLLLSSFTLKQNHDHTCLVTPIMDGDLYSLIRSFSPEDGRLPLPLAKRVVLHMLRGLTHAHSRGVMHTDLAPDKVLFSSPDREDGVSRDPASQPPTVEEALRYTYVVAGFDTATIVGEAVQERPSIPLLLPPEVILGGDWTEKVDIWTVGCLVFDLLTGSSLFKDTTEWHSGVEMDLLERILFQMLFMSHERFSPDQLAQSSRGYVYFEPDGTFRPSIRISKNRFAYEGAIEVYVVLDEKDAKATGDLLRRCLRLNPNDRPSAKELLSDPWFNGVD